MELDSDQVLRVQVIVNLVAWSAIATTFVAPRLAKLELRRALRVWMAPQMFRVIGMTMLASGVVGNLPADFREAVAFGDLVTAVLAIVAFVTLSRPGKLGPILAALATVIGMADLVRNVIMGARLHTASELHGAWLVVSTLVPLMLVAHVAVAVRLVTAVRTRTT